MCSQTPQGPDWLKRISPFLHGAGINRPWIPLKCLLVVPVCPTSALPTALYANSGKWRLVDVCISSTLWKHIHFWWKLQIILITIPSPLPCLYLLVCVLILLAFTSLIFPPSIPIIPFHPPQSGSLHSMLFLCVSHQDTTLHEWQFLFTPSSLALNSTWNDYNLR